MNVLKSLIANFKVSNIPVFLCRCDDVASRFRYTVACDGVVILQCFSAGVMASRLSLGTRSRVMV